MICVHCGKEIKGVPVCCPYCNADTVDSIPSLNISKRSRLVYVLLTCFLGWYGINRFYLDDDLPGACKLILGLSATFVIGLYRESHSYFWCWLVPLIIVVIWNIVDLIWGIQGKITDSYGQVIRWR